MSLQPGVPPPQPTANHHVLVIAEERDAREALTQYFLHNGFRITAATCAHDARNLLGRYIFDLVILDISMRHSDGLSFCRSIREKLDIPTIILSAKAEPADRIVGLEMGADDYLVTPVVQRELLARARAVIRRAQSVPRSRLIPDQKALHFSTWTLETGARKLIDEHGATVALSTGEFQLLLTFLERPHIVLSREQLLDLTQGREATLFDRSIDNLVARLRKKIEPDTRQPVLIKTVWGGGYTFVADVRAE